MLGIDLEGDSSMGSSDWTETLMAELARCETPSERTFMSIAPQAAKTRGAVSYIRYSLEIDEQP